MELRRRQTVGGEQTGHGPLQLAVGRHVVDDRGVERSAEGGDPVPAPPGVADERSPHRAKVDESFGQVVLEGRGDRTRGHLSEVDEDSQRVGGRDAATLDRPQVIDIARVVRRHPAEGWPAATGGTGDVDRVRAVDVHAPEVGG